MEGPQNDAVLSREKVNTTLTSLLAQSSTLLLQYDAVWEEMELERKKLEWKNKYLKKRAREVEERERSVEERRKEVDVTYELVRKEREWCRWKARRVRKRERKVKEMERVWRESGVEGDEKKNDGYADIRIKVRMNGRDLLNFLNGRVNDHEVLREEVVRGLALSRDPGKLVLDAVEGFYKEEGGGEEEEVVRKSCVLLLEELMRMGVEIGGKVRERAARVALEWKGKMRVGGGGKRWWLEVVGFLQLVASYGLVDGFEKEEILMLFESCACYERSPQLCVCLGFGDCVCGMFVRSFICVVLCLFYI